ncbi:hypothetical protein BsWGS_17120 [Bradybaena similaris]
MISRLATMFACSLLLASMASGNYVQPLLADRIQQESVSQTRGPAMTIISLCWDGNDVIDVCQKHSTFLRQLLNKLLNKMKMERRRSNGVMFVNEEQQPEPKMVARKRQEEASRFYSNW